MGVNKEKLQQTPLQAAEKSTTYELNDEDVVSLAANQVKKKLGEEELVMFGYNNQIPGPLLRVQQHSKAYINFTNNLDQPTTIHWHGLRHNYKFDGVPDISQDPVQPGESFLYELSFPDDGLFWYHPHVREDVQQEKGLYGAIVVEPNKGTQSEPRIIILDDILIAEDGDFHPFSPDVTNFALMGRFGNVMLVNGEQTYRTTAYRGEKMQFYMLNVANARPFNIVTEGTKMKVIGSDLSHYNQPFVVDSLVIAPAERYLVEMQFDRPGTYKILNSNPLKTYVLGEIVVEGNTEEGAESREEEAQEPKINVEQYIKQQPEYTFKLTIDMQGMDMSGMVMHDGDVIEWEDTMFMMNSMHNNRMMRWIIQDEETGKQNMDASREVNVGDMKVIRLINDETSDHPMQHPIHLHGQRMVVLRQDGQENTNPVWKDTVLIPKGSTVDLLVEFSNPGQWMMHCHIAEHLEAGMMAVFAVKGEPRVA